MSILDETRSYLSAQRTKLQDERTQLVGERDKLSAQIDEIDDLLRRIDSLDNKSPRVPRTTERRAGIREQVLAAVKAKPRTAAQIRAALNISDKTGNQAVSNALSALKKAGKLTLTPEGTYTTAK